MELKELFGKTMASVEDVHVLHKMRQYGGGFVRALAEAGFNADSQNLAKIKAAWPDLWAEYSAWARASRKMEAETRPESFGDSNPPLSLKGERFETTQPRQPPQPVAR